MVMAVPFNFNVFYSHENKVKMTKTDKRTLGRPAEYRPYSHIHALGLVYPLPEPAPLLLDPRFGTSPGGGLPVTRLLLQPPPCLFPSLLNQVSGNNCPHSVCLLTLIQFRSDHKAEVISY